jgi:LAO/AO transport system kinase
MVDFFLLLMLAGAGDELQGIKRGIFELADAVAINKADGDNLPKAKRAAAEYQAALRLLRTPTPGWETPVLTVSAVEARGMDAVWEIVVRHRALLEERGELERRRAAQRRSWLWSMLKDGLEAHFLARSDVVALLPKVEQAVDRGSITPTEGARRLLALLDRSK